MSAIKRLRRQKGSLIMKHFKTLLLVMAFVLISGCASGSNDTPEPTPTAVPTNTPEPTDVIMPTSTPAETPTPTIRPYSDAVAETNSLYESRPVSLKQMEYLKRGAVAVPLENSVFISWRFLGTDPEDIAFNLYKNGTLLNSAPISGATNYTDNSAPSADSTYTIIPVIDGKEDNSAAESFSVFAKEYLSIPVVQYEAGDYDINDASVGDLDGDGEYEIVVRRNPANMEMRSRVAYPLIEAYEMDGTHLWTINIGPNEVNTIDINFLVYDFDGDGRAEVVTRSFEGTIDGAGNEIGDVNGDGKTNYEKSIYVFKDRQYLSDGPEFLSAYDGQTGAEIARTPLLPERDPLTSWMNSTDEAKLTKRASHYLFCVAYLDGVTPSIVHFRGCWAACKLAAYDFKNGEFSVLWTVDCEKKKSLTNLYETGYHSIAVADIDFDGKDEVLSGSVAIDDNGEILYITTATKEDGTIVKLTHGDAFDVAKMNPDYNGYYVWACRETPNLPVNIGLHDARTGDILFGFTKPKDTGRCRAADLDPTSRGYEVWGSTGTPLLSITGEVLNESSPSSMNMKMYWDGDLLSELLDHNSNSNMVIMKWDWEKKTLNDILVAEGSASNGGTKGQTCLAADIFGDWRDELMVRTADSTELRIYSTTIPTEYRIPTLMHDVTYREAIAWQNNHYNQPANVSFYLGAETTEVPVPEIYTLKDGEKIINSVYTSSPGKHAFISVLPQ